MQKLSFRSAEAARDSICAADQKRIKDLYHSWSKEVGKRAEYYAGKTNASARYQERQMLVLQRQMEEQAVEISRQLQEGVKEGMYIISDAVASCYGDFLKDLGFPDGSVSAAMTSIPPNVVNNIVTGQIYEGGWNLSAAIWGDQQQTLSDIYAIVAQGRAMNMSVYEVSKMLEQYVNPSRAKQWNLTMKDGVKIYKKSVDYNAQRLVRTLNQHAYQQSVIQVTKDSPFYNSIIWRANGSRACPLCLDRDGNEYKADDIPMDHPNGMCVMEPKVDMDDVVNKLADWINNPDGTYPELDEFAKKFGYVPDVKKNVKDNKEAGGNKAKSSKWNSVMDRAWCKANCTSPRMAQGWKDVEGLGGIKKIRDNIADRLSQPFVSDEYRQAFARAAQSIKNYTSKDKGCYFGYSFSGKKMINLDKYGTYRSSRTNHVGTLYHEMGHAIDALASGERKYSSMSKYGFQDAMVNDLLNIEKRLSESKEFVADLKFGIFTDDDSSGIQDIFSATSNMGATEYKGFTKKGGFEKMDRITGMCGEYDINPNWKHSDQYWQRSDAVQEAASELFAHISAAQVSPEEMEMMQDLFPESVKAFDKILVAIMK